MYLLAHLIQGCRQSYLSHLNSYLRVPLSMMFLKFYLMVSIHFLPLQFNFLMVITPSLYFMSMNRSYSIDPSGAYPLLSSPTAASSSAFCSSYCGISPSSSSIFLSCTCRLLFFSKYFSNKVSFSSMLF